MDNPTNFGLLTEVALAHRTRHLGHLNLPSFVKVYQIFAYLVAVDHYDFVRDHGVFRTKHHLVGIRVVKQPYHWSFEVLAHQDVVDVSLPLMGIARLLPCLQLHRDVHVFLNHPVLLDYLPSQKQVYFPLEPEVCAPEHLLAGDNFFDD